MCTFFVSNEGPNEDILLPEEHLDSILIDTENAVSDVCHKAQLLLKKNLEIYLEAVDKNCVKAFFVASQLALLGYFSYVFPVYTTKTNQITVKIKVYKP